MSCCLGFEASKEKIEEIVRRYHEKDYKLFVAHRYVTEGITYKVKIGVVVKPDLSKNTEMFEELMGLHSSTEVCVKMLTSDINFEDGRLVDLFLLEIESEVGR